MANFEDPRMQRMMEEMQLNDSLRLYNSLTENAFQRCVTNFRIRKLDNDEDLCVTRYTEKYLRAYAKIGRVFSEQSMIQQHQQAQAAEIAAGSKNEQQQKQ